MPNPPAFMDSPGPLGVGPHYTRTPGTVGVADELDPGFGAAEVARSVLLAAVAGGVAAAADVPAPAAVAKTAEDVTKAYLDTFVGNTVEDFCKLFGKKQDTHNHCAHFVSHALDLRMGKLCSVMTWAGKNKHHEGRTILVDDVFNACTERGYWKDKPAELDPCLIFGILKKGLTTKSNKIYMSAIREKHIGVYIQGRAYNYHNGSKNPADEGVKHDAVEFFEGLYGANTVVLYGSLPK